MGGDAIWDAVERPPGHRARRDHRRRRRSPSSGSSATPACDYAPVVMANWEFFDNQTPDSVDRAGRRAPRGQDDAARPAAPTRVATFKEVTRVLAGFHDGRATRASARASLTAGLGSPSSGSATAPARPGSGPSRVALHRGTSPVPTQAGERTRDRRRSAPDGRDERDDPADAGPVRGSGTSRESWTAGDVRAVRRLPGAAQGHGGGPKADLVQAGQGLRPARPRRRRLPDRA